jgi:hypothetical protein
MSAGQNIGLPWEEEELIIGKNIYQSCYTTLMPHHHEFTYSGHHLYLLHRVCVEVDRGGGGGESAAAGG